MVRSTFEREADPTFHLEALVWLVVLRVPTLSDPNVCARQRVSALGKVVLRTHSTSVFAASGGCCRKQHVPDLLDRRRIEQPLRHRAHRLGALLYLAPTHAVRCSWCCARSHDAPLIVRELASARRAVARSTQHVDVQITRAEVQVVCGGRDFVAGRGSRMRTDYRFAALERVFQLGRCARLHFDFITVGHAVSRGADGTHREACAGGHVHL